MASIVIAPVTSNSHYKEDIWITSYNIALLLLQLRTIIYMELYRRGETKEKKHFDLITEP